MVKPKISLDDIPVARPRTQRLDTAVLPQEPEQGSATAVGESIFTETEAFSDTQSGRSVEPATTSPKQEDPKPQAARAPNDRRGLRALKASRPQKGDYVLSVSLEERLRDRLARASFESKVKQTNIVREAIDEFLRREGY